VDSTYPDVFYRVIAWPVEEAGAVSKMIALVRAQLPTDPADSLH